MWCSNLWHPTWGFTHLCVRRDDQQQRDMHVNKTREKRWLVSYVVLSVQQCRARSFRVKVIQSQRLVQRSLVVHAPSLVVHSWYPCRWRIATRQRAVTGDLRDPESWGFSWSSWRLGQNWQRWIDSAKMRGQGALVVALWYTIFRNAWFVLIKLPCVLLKSPILFDDDVQFVIISNTSGCICVGIRACVLSKCHVDTSMVALAAISDVLCVFYLMESFLLSLANEENNGRS